MTEEGEEKGGKYMQVYGRTRLMMVICNNDQMRRASAFYVVEIWTR